MYSSMIIKETEDFGRNKAADLNNIRAGAFASISTREGQKAGKDLYNTLNKCYENMQKKEEKEEDDEEKNPDTRGLFK